MPTVGLVKSCHSGENRSPEYPKVFSMLDSGFRRNDGNKFSEIFQNQQNRRNQIFGENLFILHFSI